MPGPDSEDLVSLFVSPLNRLQIAYMVTGALAAGLYGQPRLTNDVDIVLALGRRDISRFHGAFDPAAFYVPPVEAIERESTRARYGHLNLIHHDSAYRADLYFAGEDALNEWGLAQRIALESWTDRVWVAPPEYVIVRKLEYLRDRGSQKHVADIQMMLQVLGDRVDRAMLTREVAARGLTETWSIVAGG